MNEYLRAFVIGSSFLVFIPFFYAVSNFDRKKINFDYIPYTFLAPFALGVMNVASLIISNYFGFTKNMRFLFMSIFAPTCVLITVYYFGIYNYTIEEWINHIWKLYLLYFIVFNIVVRLLDKYV